MFEYDAFGRRVEKTINGMTTGYLYDGQTIVQELAGGSVEANQLNGGGLDNAYTRTDSSGTSTYLKDALGSTIALVDGTGAVATEYSYEPFGTTTVSGATNSNASQFTGRENDGTGLYYYRARYYSPMLGRFISQDPIGFAGSDINLYAYTNNNPSNFIDPTGLCFSAGGGGDITL